ncbi:MAG: hypothetical protein WAO31_03245 [Rhodoluna sp.]
MTAKTLGLMPPEERSVDVYQRMMPWAQNARGLQPGGTAIVGDSIVKDLDPAMFGGGAIVLGAGGITVPILREMQGVLGLLEPAGSLVVCAGVNDLKYRGPEVVASDYLDFVTGLPEGPRILCLSVLPLNEEVAPAHGRDFISNNEIEALNRLLEEGLRGSKRLVFTDVRGVVQTAAGMPIPAAYQSDGWHLSDVGLQRLASAIRDSL